MENNRIPDSFSIMLVFCYCLGDGREFNLRARWSLTALALEALSGMEFFLEVIPRVDGARWPCLIQGGMKEREFSQGREVPGGAKLLGRDLGLTQQVKCREFRPSFHGLPQWFLTCLRSPGPPVRMEISQDPSWESLMDVLPSPTGTGPFAANSGCGVGFEGRGFGIHRLPPKATGFLPEGILFSLSSRFPALYWDFFFFLPAHLIPFPKPLDLQERLWSSLIRNLTSPPVTFASPAPGAVPGC